VITSFRESGLKSGLGTSVMEYKGPRALRNRTQLGVDGIVEGSVSGWRSGPHQLQLLDGSPNDRIVSEHYQRELRGYSLQKK